MNTLRRGPYSTIHRADGTLADEIFWYENRWWHRKGTVKFKETEKDLQKHFSRWWRKATQKSLSDLISKGLLRYCHALDDHDMDVTLTRLWSTLELMTGTGNAKYDVTVTRITRLFTSFEDARLIAEHVRRQRNATVHTASSPDENLVTSTIHHAEMLCSRILKFCIFEGDQFKEPSELYEFLDNPTDLSVVRRNRRLSASYLRYRQQFEADDNEKRSVPSPVLLTRSK